MHRQESSPQRSMEMQRVLEEVTIKFLERCSHQVSILERFLEEVEKGGVKADPSGVHQEAHKICGIARTLGFSNMGDAAENLEKVTTSEAWVQGAYDFGLVQASLDDLLNEMQVALEANSIFPMKVPRC